MKEAVYPHAYMSRTKGGKMKARCSVFRLSLWRLCLVHVRFFISRVQFLISQTFFVLLIFLNIKSYLVVCELLIAM